MGVVQGSTDEVLDFLLSSPTLEEVLAFKPSEVSVERVRTLRDKNRNDELMPEEAAEFNEVVRLNQLMSVLKARAGQKLSDK